MRVIYFIGYSHARGFGGFAIVSNNIKKIEDLPPMIDYAVKKIVEANPSLTYDEIAIISLSQIPIPQKKEGLIDRLRSLWSLIIGGLK